MRTLFAILCLILASAFCAPSLSAQEKPLHGIDVSDLDRKVSPCQDFYEFANGTWRAHNPIPASQVIWSKRWAAGESTKEVLHGILEEASANAASAPAKSTERLIGDYYGACMNEKAINALGVGALKRELEMIRSIKTLADLQTAITKLNEEAIYAPFGFGSTQDPHHPTQVIADAFAAGLGLPDRDYYFKDDAKSKETRQKYVEHVSAMFVLAGFDQTVAAAAAQTVMKMETGLAGASLTNVALRDPYATDHKMNLDEAQKITPDFNWAVYFQAQGLNPTGAINVDQPQFLQEFQWQLQQTSLDDWKTYLTWAPAAFRCAQSFRPLRRGKFRVQSKISARRGRNEAALEALRGIDRRKPGRGVGQEVRGKDIFPRSESAHAGNGE